MLFDKSNDRKIRVTKGFRRNVNAQKVETFGSDSCSFLTRLSLMMNAYPLQLQMDYVINCWYRHYRWFRQIKTMIIQVNLRTVQCMNSYMSLWQLDCSYIGLNYHCTHWKCHVDQSRPREVANYNDDHLHSVRS